MKSSRQLRNLGMTAAIVVLGSGCASDVASGTGGLGSAAAAVACSDVVFWGTVQGTLLDSGGLHVTFLVDDWVRPAAGDARITLVGDDPAQNIGAPDWSTAERMLVMDGRDSPLDMLRGEAADEVIAEWERADPPASCPDSY